MKSNYFILYILLLFKVCIAEIPIRFKNDELMRSHHHHQNFLPSENPSKLLSFKNIEPIKVHLIPHSHNDVGWLKTANDYFWGYNRNFQFGQVQYILDSVIGALELDPSKRFVYAEMFFFVKWWNQQPASKKSTVQNLVRNGQLEFVNGGWVMNDEGSCYFEDIIDQLTFGHKFLKEVFNYTVKIGWQLDPFGHSSTQANIFASMGFDAMFFSRIDYQDRERRTETKNLEFIWKPEVSRASDGIFSILTYYHYSAPPGFNFDESTDEQPIVDEENSSHYNVHEKSMELVDYFKNMALHYKQTEIIHLLGDDFQYSNAHKYFKNIDRLIDYIEKHSEWGVKIFYSTPSEYINSINKLNIEYDVKTDDFMPYADAPHAYWTGYFSSRPGLKGMVKEAGRIFQTIRNLFALVQFREEENKNVKEMRRDMMESVVELQKAMAVLQHHDAVSGTATQEVCDNYKEILDNGVDRIKEVRSRKNIYCIISFRV